ncbi:hypothetical protein ILUMI_19671, partial [Ignelater luminosus]
LREIPSGSEDSELSDDDTDELRFEPIATVPTFRNLQVNGNDNDDGFSDTDDVQLAQIAGTSKKRIQKWRKTDTRRNDTAVEFEGNSLLPEHILKLDTPYKLFCHFLPEDFVTAIVRQTCICSVQQQLHRPITTALKKFSDLWAV